MLLLFYYKYFTNRIHSSKVLFPIAKMIKKRILVRCSNKCTTPEASHPPLCLLFLQRCTSKLRLSGRRQEIRVTLTTAVPCPLSFSNDVVWLRWHRARNLAIAEVRKIGHCLYSSCTWAHAGSICFLPFSTVALSVILYLGGGRSILFSKHQTVLLLPYLCADDGREDDHSDTSRMWKT